ncbi:hypothetical protein [uncultured Roseovarius sp.]|uniref:hypothetical protein n=1 Tax=uncultured Roseovarius sp. TaxID=293344 RepID=UPI00263845F0|nr:hypothetical protein [uncultured Roseovarius sp.]
MKHLGKITLAASFFLTSCAPLQIFYKEGETVARMERDQTTCEVSALRQVPTDIRSRYIPPVYEPYQYCHGYGHCYWRHQLISPGRYERYDANEGLRSKVSDQCMADQGYARAKIKRCDTATTRATRLRATQVLPPLTAQSCAIRLKSGRWKIVTPGAE